MSNRTTTLGPGEAPLGDPYLRPETVRTEIHTIGGIDLPPIFAGMEPGRSLGPDAQDYAVRVTHVGRREIDTVLHAMEHEAPAMREVLGIVRAFMCRLDTMRDEAKLRLTMAQAHLRSGDMPALAQTLADARSTLGERGEQHRLYVH